MPTICLKSRLLFEYLGSTFTETEFDQLCFDFGIELDDVTFEADNEGDESIKEEVYHIDIPANRYDLLCVEGLSRALRVFLEREKAPVFRTITPSSSIKSTTKIRVLAETSQVRPFVVAAVLRNLSWSEEAYKSCIDLQDQLHRNICRRRTLVAIGTHNLDAIEGPFTYEALPPEKINFQHLFADKPMNGKQMMEWFRNDPAGLHIKEYTDIIYDSPVYPVIYDRNRTVLSLPPIINGAASKIGPETKNMLIECTATDMTKAKIVLNTIVCMFSRYCSVADSVEEVEVLYDKPVVPGGSDVSVSKSVTPDLSTWSAKARIDTLKSTIGIDIEAERVPKLCERMQLGPARLMNDSSDLFVTVPPTRSDILHEVDIIEDVAIAYGYNNIPRTVPVSHQAGKELPINLISDLLRHEISRQGFGEALTLGLCSSEENFGKLNMKDDGSAVRLSNPKSIEFEVLRTTLLPGILKTLKENLSQKFSGAGIKLFEISDVVLRDPKTSEEIDVGCRNERHLAAMHAGVSSSFETLHGLVDRLMMVLSVMPAEEYVRDIAESDLVQDKIKSNSTIGVYKVVEHEEPFYLPLCGGAVYWRPNNATDYRCLGTLGVLHPHVLEKFGINFPVTVLELNIESFARE